MQAQLNRIETKLDELLTMKGTIEQLTEAKRLERRRERERKAAVRVAVRAERDESSLPLADDIFRKDKRLQDHWKKWALKGMECGARNRPEEFANWLAWQWNTCTFNKKPITFSGGYFQDHVGEGSRMHTTAFELMGLSKKNKMILKNDAEHTDFRDRKWWSWGYAIMSQVYAEMEDLPGFAALPDRFVRCCKILAGGFGMYEVYTGLYFDPFADLPDLNRMLRRVGPELTSMWTACMMGLRKRKEKVVTEAHTPPSPPSH